MLKIVKINADQCSADKQLKLFSSSLMKNLNSRRQMISPKIGFKTGIRLYKV